MPIERAELILPEKPDNRFLILYGKGVSDTYVSDQLTELRLEEVLLARLKEAEYKRVVFYSPQRSVYFLDHDSRHLSQPSQKGGETQLLSLSSHSSSNFQMANGPLEEMRLIPIKESLAQTEMGDLHSLRLLDAVIRQEKEYRSAVVFVQAETAFHYFEDQRILAGLVGEWTHLPAINPNLCILLFSVDSFEGLVECIKTLPIPEVRELVLRSQDNRQSTSHLVQLGGPDPGEIGRLIHYIHLKTGMRFLRRDLSKLSNWMAAEEMQAGQWMRRLQTIDFLSLEMLIQRGWLEGHQVRRETPWQKLEALTGLVELKRHLREMVALAALNLGNDEINRDYEQAPSLHMVFTGSPGTGKTTVAKLVGEIYHELGLLRRGHLVEAHASELVADHVGGTGIKTRSLIQKALDGVLFIDEAYTLTEAERGSFGQEALETLLAGLEDERHRLVVIAAGYPGRMEKFLSSNPGLRRRFPQGNILHFPDFNEEELWQILSDMLQRRKIPYLDQMEMMLKSVIHGLVANRDESFGNAGEMRNLVDGLARRRAGRIHTQNLEFTANLIDQDLPVPYQAYLPIATPNLDELFIELEKLVGLSEFKQYLTRQVRKMQLAQLRQSEVGDEKTPNYLQHLVFCGNPGTGKTTVARLMSKFYQGLGLLHKGHCVEVSRAELVAGFVGQTAIKTMDAIRQALDGVLFIDEAYSLFHSERHDDFGSEVVDTLVKAMDDYRGRLVVITAGYPTQMEQFLQSNPGLRSRFAPPIYFRDFSTDELLTILQRLAASENFSISEEAIDALHVLFAERQVKEKDHFGNARTVQEIYERMKENLADRVLSIPEQPILDINSLTLDDVPESSVSQGIWINDLYPSNRLLFLDKEKQGG